MERIRPSLALIALATTWMSLSTLEAVAAGIVVTPTAGLVTGEAGQGSQFSIGLTSQPTDVVMISLASTNPNEGDLSTPAVVFTPLDWNIPQVVTITGVDDLAADGHIVYAILVDPALSADVSYSGLDVADVVVMNLDNDFAEIRVSPAAGLVTSEAGNAAEFSIVLASQPADDVTIPLLSTNPNEGDLSTPAVVFTPLDWNIPQFVTITGVDDALNDGHILYGILTAPAASSDPVYAGRDAHDISVMNLDDEAGTVGVLPDEQGANLVLEAVRPNPLRGSALSVRFALPSTARAHLELIDVAGRSLDAREVGTLGVGRHSVSLGEQGVPPGVYWVHLIQGSERRTTRVSVIR